MMEKKVTVRVLVFLVVIGVTASAGAIAFVPFALADDVSGTATVSNNPPSIEVATSDLPGNPESLMTITVTVTDPDHLSDIENVVVKAYDNALTAGDADDIRNHYTFWFDPSDNSWHSSLSNPMGGPFVQGDINWLPDLSVDQDNYTFGIRLNGTAVPKTWNIFCKVEDAAGATDSVEKTDMFTVQTYISYNLLRNTIDFGTLDSGTSNNPMSSPPMVANQVETNVSYDVNTSIAGAWQSSKGDTFSGSNTKFNSTDDAIGATSISTSSKSIYVGQPYAEDVNEIMYYWLDIPSEQPKGSYTNTIYIELAES